MLGLFAFSLLGCRVGLGSAWAAGDFWQVYGLPWEPNQGLSCPVPSSDEALLQEEVMDNPWLAGGAPQCGTFWTHTMRWMSQQWE